MDIICTTNHGTMASFNVVLLMLIGCPILTTFIGKNDVVLEQLGWAINKGNAWKKQRFTSSLLPVQHCSKSLKVNPYPARYYYNAPRTRSSIGDEVDFNHLPNISCKPFTFATISLYCFYMQDSKAYLFIFGIQDSKAASEFRCPAVTLHTCILIHVQKIPPKHGMKSWLEGAPF